MPRHAGTVQRGYGYEHRRLRAQWAPRVATGQVSCRRCHLLIAAGADWDLGHKEDRSGWSGPEHALCNRQAGARRGNRLRLTRATRRRHTRNW